MLEKALECSGKPQSTSCLKMPSVESTLSAGSPVANPGQGLSPCVAHRTAVVSARCAPPWADRKPTRDLSWPWEASDRPLIARNFTAVTQLRQACWVSVAITVSADRSAVCEQAHWQSSSSPREEPLCQWVHSTRLDESTVTVCRR